MTPDPSLLQSDPVNLIHAIKVNDEKALRLLYVENFRRVESYIIQNNGSTEEAKDIYQEAFIAVWRNIQLDRFEAQNSQSLNAYLVQIAKNKWLDFLRSSNYRKVRPLHDEERIADETNSTHEVYDERVSQVKLHFKDLGEVCRELLKRFYYQRQSMKTISEAMNWTEPTARNNKYRCLQKLRDLLKK